MKYQHFVLKQLLLQGGMHNSQLERDTLLIRSFFFLFFLLWISWWSVDGQETMWPAWTNVMLHWLEAPLITVCLDEFVIDRCFFPPRREICESVLRRMFPSFCLFELLWSLFKCTLIFYTVSEFVFLCCCLFITCVQTKLCQRRRTGIFRPSSCLTFISSFYSCKLICAACPLEFVRPHCSVLLVQNWRPHKVKQGEHLVREMRSISGMSGSILANSCTHAHLQMLSHTWTFTSYFYYLSVSPTLTCTIIQKHKHSSAVTAAADRGCCRTMETLEPIRCQVAWLPTGTSPSLFSPDSRRPSPSYGVSASPFPLTLVFLCGIKIGCGQVLRVCLLYVEKQREV